MRIGWIGTGVMGRSMAGHLLDAGHELFLHTRTRSKAEELLARGAQWANDPAAAADRAEVVFSMVSLPADVEAVHLGRRGTLEAKAPPGVIVDMSTAPPALSRRLAKRAAELGIGAVDAPVSGGDVGARNATLSIMVGGSDDDVATVHPLLERLGKTIVHQGASGSGQHCKIVNQILVAAATISMSEALAYAQKAGLDPQKMLESVGGGAAGSWTIQHLAPRVLRGDFEPGFLVEHLVKDLGIAAEGAAGMELDLPGLALAKRLYEELAAAGHGKRGTQAMALRYLTTVPPPAPAVAEQKDSPPPSISS